MKTIPDHMDLSKPIDKAYGEPCVSQLFKYMQEASRASTRGEVDSSKYNLLRMQGHCCKLVHELSVNEDIYRDNPEHNGPEMLDQQYTDLITFVSGVGVACGEAIERLDSFDMIETDQFIAMAQSVTGK